MFLVLKRGAEVGDDDEAVGGGDADGRNQNCYS